MLELPEVETMRRGLLPACGQRVKRVLAPPCECRPILIRPHLDQLAAALERQSLLQVNRVGKRIVLEFSGQKTLVIEPRMTGLVLLADPPDLDHLRLRFEFTGQPRQLLFWDRRGLGTVTLYPNEEWQALLASSKWGPDALGTDGKLLQARLGSSRRAVKVALLDQAALAGVGNLYAAEALHAAKLDPRRPCNAIKPREWSRLAEALVAILHEAIRYEGSTLNDGTYRNALNQAGNYQNHHRVYDRAGAPCLNCNRGQIVRIVQAQRATFYCPGCQK